MIGRQNKQKLGVLMAALVGMFISGAVVAQPIGDVNAGREKSQACIACHNANGVSDNPAWPILAGQHADYLVHVLREYRSGERVNAIMNGQAQGLSDEDIRDLAAFYAAQDPALSVVRRGRARR